MRGTSISIEKLLLAYSEDVACASRNADRNTGQNT